ncbi:hypothetical protein LS68_007455 [Helicobacter sp. MIT 05-5293]|uniref:hypothetical protein n=1 Tax=Helicobacter sp. MIT 05-5293 TaxID=1548149 RepID=UPI000ADC2F5D|nr:hypothetical protein [Helicobacter sp. MIT 05-5293]TLD80563.1 hypothetical protein LS68_007455 [Helicobacter sp. MIT 05-5293]
MRLLIILCLLGCHILFANTQVNHIDFTQNPDTFELTIHTQTPYNHNPKLTEKENYKGIILPQIQAASKNHPLKNFFLSEVQIFNIQDNLYILGIGDPQTIKVTMRKSSKGDMIKIIFHATTPPKSQLDLLVDKSLNEPLIAPTLESVNPPIPTHQNPTDSVISNTQNPQLQTTLPLKNDLGIDTWRYIAVLGVMALLVLVLWIVKKYIVSKKNFPGYLGKFNTKKEHFDPTKVDIVSQKNIDSKNRILTIESNGYRYLLLIGMNSTTLIDRYPIPQDISTQEQIMLDDQFARLLEQKKERLSQYLQDDEKPSRRK